MLDEKELLQANATIIAGILILLTIGSNLIATELNLSIATKIFLAVAILPFIVAGVIVLSPRFRDEGKKVKYAQIMTMAGLVYLGVAVLYFVLLL